MSAVGTRPTVELERQTQETTIFTHCGSTNFNFESSVSHLHIRGPLNGTRVTEWARGDLNPHILSNTGT